MNKMNLLNILCILLISIVITNCEKIGYGTPSSVSNSQVGAAVDEVIVVSSLYIKKKPQIRRIRDLSNVEISNPRFKRQFRQRPISSSQSAANAAANSNYFGPNGFGASAAHGQAQGFQTQGPLGGFGANAANTQTQSFSAGQGGIQGSAGISGSQNYRLPNGQNINVAYGGSFSGGPGGISSSKSNGITISK